ncbi:acetoin utilization protein AcuB [Sinobaca qinghaiensis]|uniref:Acetoin utilization protein AcuB n=1 Tax=Sinobaca qinghaiensis TaxID=342944 RepID=A0A419UVX5_9BACL|nr:acetoin utilization AcuB family protein [Sinobaca qinghaiensis]RKD68746.1 acetoin utilization protein AcuB [Sinobaca qinghaiensis]
MLVEEIMKTDMVKINKDTTIQEAMDLLQKHRIRHIPVVDEDMLIVGIVSDRDIRDASPSVFQLNALKEELNRPVSDIMKYPVITAHPLDFVEEAAVVLFENDISALPVAVDDKLVGMLTETKVLHTIVKLTGAHQPSSQIEVVVPNIYGHLADLSALFKKHKINITSVLVYPSEDLTHKVLTFRVQTMDPRPTMRMIEEAGYHVKWPHFPGIE